MTRALISFQKMIKALFHCPHTCTYGWASFVTLALDPLIFFPLLAYYIEVPWNVIQVLYCLLVDHRRIGMIAV